MKKTAHARYRSYHMLGYLRAKADRETGKFVRTGSMGEFRGVQDENRRVLQRSWKAQRKTGHQWK